MKRLRNAMMVLFCVTAIASSEAQQAFDPATGLPLRQEKRFDLEFKGGKPEELVQAVERAAGMPVNVIIPTEHSRVFIPPLKLREVTVGQVFNAISQASKKTEIRQQGWLKDQNGQTQPRFVTSTHEYGFRPSDADVWYFFNTAPMESFESRPETKQQCRFWQLEPHLDRFTIDDITTAIETGWDMLTFRSDGRNLKFHKETKLLIAVGNQDELLVIDDALRQLTQGRGTAKVKEPAAKPEASGTGKPERR